jgi:hypothetical protein
MIIVSPDEIDQLLGMICPICKHYSMVHGGASFTVTIRTCGVIVFCCTHCDTSFIVHKPSG